MKEKYNPKNSGNGIFGSVIDDYLKNPDGLSRAVVGTDGATRLSIGTFSEIPSLLIFNELNINPDLRR